MPYLLRITRPEDPSFLLAIIRSPDNRLQGFEAAYFAKDAAIFSTLEAARGTAGLLNGAKSSDVTPEQQLAWKFKNSVLAYDPWINTETKCPDAKTTPDDWETRVIEGAKITILDSQYQPIEHIEFKI